MKRTFVTALVLVVTGNALVQASVNSIEPHYGSLFGGTRLTIYGTGFSADQFAFGNGNSNKGNLVTLVSKSDHSLDCLVHKEGCTQTQLMCYTPRDMVHDVPYYVKVKVDGTAVPTAELCASDETLCAVTTRWWNTPTIETLTPQSGKPGEIILTMYGRIITTRYGSNTTDSSNGRTERILRAFSPQNCDLKYGDQFYGLELETETSLKGTLKCKPTGTFIGYANVSFLVEAPFGSSQPKPELYRVSRNGDIYLVQYYTDISAITPAEGSTNGGVTLTVNGDFFEDAGPLSTYSNAEVYVGGAPCKNIQVVTNSHLTCEVPVQQLASSFRGNRGVLVEYWDSPPFSDYSMAYNSVASSTGTKWFDETRFCTDDINLKWTRMTGIFVAPEDGKYQFYIEATNGGALYINGTFKGTSTGSWTFAGSVILTKNNELTLVAVSRSGSNPLACVAVKVLHFNTKFTHSMTGQAVPEIQRLLLTSPVVNEEYTLSITGFSSQTLTNEVQTVCAAGDRSNIRLGLFGVYTIPMSFDDTATMTSELNKLPFLASNESFSIAVNTADATCVDITFNSQRGNIPVITSTSTGVTVKEKIQGVPSNTKFSLMYGNVPSPLITFNDSDRNAFATQLQDAINTMFSVRCPAMFTSATGHYQNFEGGEAQFGDIVSSEVPAFCGRYSTKNYAMLYPTPGINSTALSLLLKPIMCFAVRNLDNTNIYMKFQSTADSTVFWEGTYSFAPLEVPSTEGGWMYTCINMQKLQPWSTVDPTSFNLIQATVTQQDNTVDFYIDELYIGNRALIGTLTDISMLRLGPAYPNTDIQTTMKSVRVVYNGNNAAPAYNVVLEPHNCGYNLDLVTMANSQVTVGSTGSNSSAATSTLFNGAGALSVIRTKTASPPLAGSFIIEYMGQTSAAIDVTLDNNQIKAVLEGSMSNIGTVTVWRSDNSTCANMDIYIQFDDQPGDRPLMTLTSISTMLKAPSANVQIIPYQDGYLALNPVPGDMIFTKHTTPQVTVYINSVPTKCSVAGEHECAFRWSSSVTPTITSITPTSGKEGDHVTISGTRFSALSNENTVVIGGVKCVVSTSTVSQITCVIGNGPIGAFPVEVTVNGVGNANTSAQFTYMADVTAINPTIGSIGGNLLLTITGFGFTSGMLVSIDSQTCAVNTVSPEEITCTVPPFTNLAATTDQTVKIVVTAAGYQLLTILSFTYQPQAAVILSVTPDEILVASGLQTITISGLQLPLLGSVRLGTVDLKIVTRNESSIIVTTPAGLTPGRAQPLYVQNGTSGIVLNSTHAIPLLDIILEVTNISPTKGSLYGGTTLTISGQGFGTNSSDLQVSVGNYNCIVLEAAYDKITCKVQHTATVHQINNEGVTGFGVYFAFSQTQLTVEEGDIVQWSWKTPEFVNAVTHGVYETENLTTFDYLPGGISSGNRSRNGMFQWQFTTVGIYYFTSGYVDLYQIKTYRMTVQVVAKSASVVPVAVFLSGQNAKYVTNTGAANPIDPSMCETVTADIPGCIPEPITTNDTTKFYFYFTVCRSPIISSVSFNNVTANIPRAGTSNTELAIVGMGFSTNDCANIATIGDCECTVTASSSTSFKCTPGLFCSYKIGVLQSISLNVNTYGYALPVIKSAIDRSIAFVPLIKTISPTSGSTDGGTAVTITGTGLSEVDMVNFNGVSATCTKDTLICIAPKASSGPVTIMVGNIEGVCETSCDFTYSPSLTPKVLSVSPSTVTEPSTVTLNGAGFGTQSSKIKVTIGGVECFNLSLISDTTIQCTVGALPAGSNLIQVNIDGIGNAFTTQTVTAAPVITALVPTTGSVHGGTLLVFSGYGFSGVTSVTANGANVCTTISVNLTTVMCVTTVHVPSSVTLKLISNGQVFPDSTFEFADSVTPMISSISPTIGLTGSILTINGQGFGKDQSSVNVSIGQANCNISSISDTQITCWVTSQPDSLSVGPFNVQVYVMGTGLSNNDVLFTYEFAVSGINPSQGDTRGNQLLTLTGSSFSNSTTVTICGKSCPVDTLVSSSKLTCLTPPGTVDQSCPVSASMGSSSTTAETKYVYVAGMSPTITSVQPSRGGTGGGTQITITGTGLSNGGSTPTVTIAGSDCSVTTTSATQIFCTTSAHVGTISVDVIVSMGALRANADLGVATFNYVDVWSSTATWGGGPVPSEGEMVVIETGKFVLLDCNTPVLGMILINGGQLIFDDKDITLKAKRILVNNGGKLQVGTRDKPFTNKAIIELYGHHRDPELPIYGTKVLAVRNGTLELHGREIAVPWTRLDGTVAAGANQITLMHAVNDWIVGDEIVIASTGDKFSQGQNEKHTISAISADKRTLTLINPLAFQHLGEDETYAGPNGNKVVQFRAEVGLLTRTIVVRGNSDSQWNRTIEKCPAGFDPGEFVVQTCFEGRFGEEKGSSQFGAHIMIHQTIRDTQIAQAHLSYVEVTFAGQAFRLGRYPVHFHMNGNMNESYVVGCAIHNTFNRAINIHASHNTLQQDNVAYDVMGGAFFLEDGIETGNTYSGNLAIFVKSSTSLLNDDITPAAFWVTNPDNSYINNAAAGGTHFGYWYRMHEHPDGPSLNTDICPRKVPLRLFRNNTAHSCGWFGLWMFQEYYPEADGNCNTANSVPAKFEDFTSWNNEKGAEFVFFGSLQVIRGVFVQNVLAGFEGKKLVKAPRRNPETSAMVNDTLIIGRANSVSLQNMQGVTQAGIVVPYGESFQVHNTKFINFDSTNSTIFKWTLIAGVCLDRCGGYNYQVSGLKFDNVLNRLQFRWGHEAVVEDLDGSLCGGGQYRKILPKWGNILPATCDNSCASATDASIVGSASCPSNIKFHRFAFNNIHPKSLQGKNLTITNQYGTSIGEYRDKRLSHKPGWMVVLVGGETYTLDFVNAENMTNVSFTGAFNEFEVGDCIIFKLKVVEKPDVASLDGGTIGREEFGGMFDCSTTGLTTGDWYYDPAGYVSFALVGASVRRKRSMTVFPNDISVDVLVQKCFFPKCIPPPDPELTPPASSRPTPFWYWDDFIWSRNPLTNVMESTGVNTGVIPQVGDNILIMDDIINSATWVVIHNASLPKLGTVTVKGGLEIDFSTTYDYVFEVDFLIIIGGRFVVGWPTDPVLGTVNIVLAGNKNSPMYTELDGYTIGGKAIGVFGGLDLHGRDIGKTWVRLTETAAANSSVINIDAMLVSKWRVGDELVITSTSYSPSETETRTITALDKINGAITLSKPLAFRHTGTVEMVDEKAIYLGAAVGMLTRSIVVRGEVNSGEAYGGRVIASVTLVNGAAKTGYVRANFTRFENMGQDGYTETYDPRFALAYIATGSVHDAKPSAVTGCSFVDLYNTAVGAFGIGGLAIENNVVYKPLGNGIVTDSADTLIAGNMITNLQWTGAYNGRSETFNSRYEAGIQAVGASGLILQDNYVAASERVGYHVSGLDCSQPNISMYNNNYAVGNLMGVVAFPVDVLDLVAGQTCTQYSGFILYKNRDYGIYYNNENSVLLSNNIYSDNYVAAFPMVVGPSAVAHICDNKTITICNSTVIGTSSSAVCASETLPSGTYLNLSLLCRGVNGPNSERLGIVFPQFTQGSNGAPGKPCAGIMAYNSLCGKMSMYGVTFVNFGVHATCGNSIAISTNQKNDDLQHPLFASQNKLINVQSQYIISIHRPNVEKINPADCVDMDCDALKKALFSDIDGSILGTSGSIIPQSEWEWGGDRRRGLNDARVPKDMLTLLDGTVISVDTLAPHGRGIVRTNQCTLISAGTYAYYQCNNTHYEMLAIESLDADTETRRLSPVAVLSDGYIDLINGPQDHGWCDGYTCQQRISTFHALVIPDKEVTIYLSSTQPDRIRFFMLYAKDANCIRISFYYINPNRIDVYTDDGANYVLPTNGEMVNNIFKLNNKAGVNYMPTCSDPVGTNFIDRDARLIYFIVKGSNKIVLQRANVIIVSLGLPAMTEAEFFGSNIIENMAAMLDIPLDRVRVVKIVSGLGSRKRRSTSGITVTFEIGNQPPGTANVTSPDTTMTVSSAVMNACLLGTIDTYINTKNASCTKIAYKDVITTVTQFDHLYFEEAILPKHEGVPFATQPKIRAYDKTGHVISNLGIKENPWKITAALRAGMEHPDAKLGGTLTSTSSSGWFNFTDLTVSHKGQYIIDFMITAPSDVTGSNINISSDLFTVAAVPLTISLSTGNIVQDLPFTMMLDLRDSTNDRIISNISWRGHSFDVSCNTPIGIGNGNMTGIMLGTFGHTTGPVVFSGISYSGYGLVYIACRVISTPTEYNFTSLKMILVMGTTQINIPSESTQRIVVRYNADYNATLPTAMAEAQLHQATLQKFIELYPNVVIQDSTITQGSILVTFTIYGAAGNVTSVVQSICSSVATGLSVTFGSTTLTLDSYMTLNGVDYYSSCGQSDDKTEGLRHAYIALIVILVVLVLATAIFVIVWRFVIRPKSKTHAPRHLEVSEYPDNGRTVFLSASNNKIEDIMYKKLLLNADPTAPLTTLYSDNPEYTNMRKSPLKSYSDLESNKDVTTTDM